MKLVTDYRGEVEYSEEDIIVLDEGMYGFAGKTKFLLIGNIEPELPFHWFQSIEDESLVFVVVDPFLFVEAYDFKIDDWTVEQLEINKIEDLIIYNTVVIPEELTETTVNLKSPIVINVANKKAKQIILEEDFPYKFKVFQEKEGE